MIMSMEEFKKIKDALVNDWGDNGIEIINYIATIPTFEGTFDDFLKLCIPCGGNWGGMLLTGIKAYNRKLWDLIPEDMGTDAFIDICYILRLLGIEFN